VLRRQPSIVLAIFLGWIFILTRTAMHRRSDLCLDCGAIQRYRTAGANVAAVFWFLTVPPTILFLFRVMMALG